MSSTKLRPDYHNDIPKFEDQWDVHKLRELGWVFWEDEDRRKSLGLHEHIGLKYIKPEPPVQDWFSGTKASL